MLPSSDRCLWTTVLGHWSLTYEVACLHLRLLSRSTKLDVVGDVDQEMWMTTRARAVEANWVAKTQGLQTYSSFKAQT